MWFPQRLELPTVSSGYGWKMEKESSSKGSFGASRAVLSKAFDCVPHELMIAKLDGYGFDLKALILVFNYLPNTKQRFKINSSYNDWYDLVIGVSQGSILGPLLFIIFIYDWFFVEIASYSDDNTPYCASHDIASYVDDNTPHCASHDIASYADDNSLYCASYGVANYADNNTPYCGSQLILIWNLILT